jgi:Domain of unknown function (DUF4189)
MRRLYVLLASVVIATLLIAVASSAGASAAPAHHQIVAGGQGGHHEETAKARYPPRQAYGALYGSSSMQTSYFQDSLTKSGAIQRARSLCQQAATDCLPGVWVKLGYAGFAMAPNGAWGTGWGSNELLAARYAQASCREVAGGADCSAILQTYRPRAYNPSGTEGGIPPP